MTSQPPDDLDFRDVTITFCDLRDAVLFAQVGDVRYELGSVTVNLAEGEPPIPEQIERRLAHRLSRPPWWRRLSRS